jgi:hypothetical protein
MRRNSGNERVGVAEWKWCEEFAAGDVDSGSECVRGRKIECVSTRCAKNFLTFAIENSFVVTLVPRFAKFDHHFFLDFIFQ